MTLRLTRTASQDEVTKPMTQLAIGYLSLGHTIRATVRTALAYSNIRRLWWPMAYYSYPGEPDY